MTARPLCDRVAVVTGASSGIGREIAITLAGAGAKVAMAARREEVLKEVEAEIRAKGGEALVVKTDVTVRQQVKDLVSKAESVYGAVDILVNCAGVYYFTLMKNLLEDEWEHTIDVNCKGVVNGIGAVLGGMMKRGQGHIVNISSDDGFKPYPGLALHSASKFFVEGLTQNLRAEVQGTGIKVTAIQPGYTLTPGLDRSVDKEADAMAADDMGKEMLRASDVADAVLYAVSRPRHVAVNQLLVQPTDLSL